MELPTTPYEGTVEGIYARVPTGLTDLIRDIAVPSHERHNTFKRRGPPISIEYELDGKSEIDSVLITEFRWRTTPGAGSVDNAETHLCAHMGMYGGKVDGLPTKNVTAINLIRDPADPDGTLFPEPVPLYVRKG